MERPWNGRRPPLGSGEPNRRPQFGPAAAGLPEAGYAAGYKPGASGGLAVSAGLGRNDALAAALEALAGAVREPEHREGVPTPVSAPVILPWNALLWREDLVPPETLLTVEQIAEATGWSKAAIYKRTSRWHREHSALVPLPHVRVGGSLRFRAGEVRQWLIEQTGTVVPGRTTPLVVGRVGRTEGAA